MWRAPPAPGLAPLGRMIAAHEIPRARDWKRRTELRGRVDNVPHHGGEGRTLDFLSGEGMGR